MSKKTAGKRTTKSALKSLKRKRHYKNRENYEAGGRVSKAVGGKNRQQPVKKVPRKEFAQQLPAADLQIPTQKVPEDVKSRGTVGGPSNSQSLFDLKSSGTVGGPSNLQSLLGNVAGKIGGLTPPPAGSPPPSTGRSQKDFKEPTTTGPQMLAPRPEGRSMSDLLELTKMSPEQIDELVKAGGKELPVSEAVQNALSNNMPELQAVKKAQADIQQSLDANPEYNNLLQEMNTLAQNPQANKERGQQIQSALKDIQNEAIMTVAPNYNQLEQAATTAMAQTASFNPSMLSQGIPEGAQSMSFNVNQAQIDEAIRRQQDGGSNSGGGGSTSTSSGGGSGSQEDQQQEQQPTTPPPSFQGSDYTAPKAEVVKAGGQGEFDPKLMNAALDNSEAVKQGASYEYNAETGKYTYTTPNGNSYELTPEQIAKNMERDITDFYGMSSEFTTQESDIQKIGKDVGDVDAPDKVTADTITAGTATAEQAKSPFGYNTDYIKAALMDQKKLPKDAVIKVRDNGDITISWGPGQKGETLSPEEVIKRYGLEGDFGGSLEAQTYEATTAEGLDPTEAAKLSTLSEGATAAVTPKTGLTKEAEAAQATQEEIDAAKGTAAQRPEAKDYMAAVTTDERFTVIEKEDPAVAERIAATISERAKKDLMDIVSTEGTDLEAIPEFKLAEKRTAQVGEAKQGIANQLGDAPSVDFEGREAITGEAPQGDASQIGGVPTLAASAMQAVTGEARKAAAADMMAVIGNMPPEVTAAVSEDPASVQAQLDTGADPTVTAAVAALPQEALVSVQMENLLAGMEEGKTPAWARPAVAAIERQMAQRGLSASTVGRDALFNAIIQSALPMAQSNAQALQQRAQQNLSNEQQATLASAQNTMQIRMQNLANRQTAASQTADMAQQIKVQQGQFRQQAKMVSADQQQQVRMQNIQNAQQRASQESAQRQQTALANLDAGTRIDLANLEAMNMAGRENLTADQQAKLATYQSRVNRIMRQAELDQDMSKANLDANLRMEMMNLTEQNAAARDTMTAENQERLTNLQTLVDFKKTNAQLAQQMDLANLNNDQQMELANLAERAATDSANMSEANRFRLQELTTYTNIMSQNTELRQRAELAKLSAAEKVELANLTAINQADSENMSAKNVASLQAYEKKMQAAQVNAQLAQQMGLANLSNKQEAAMFNAQINGNLDMKQFDANQQMALANSQFVQSMTMQNLNNKQQAAMQNATAMANLDLANVDQQTKLAINNANAFLQMDMANLANEQQALILDQQMAQQTMLSNQAAENAAKQFNATSQSQTDQFMASMEANMNQFNTAQANAMSQFNISEQNRIAAINAGNQLEAERYNAQATLQAQQFNAQMDYQVEQWNAANAQAIEQSNVAWRRQANLAETAAQNAANQQQAQFQFGMDSQMQSQMWQQMRDQAAFNFQAEQSERDRLINVINSALSNEAFMTDKNMAGQRQALFSMLNTVTGGAAGFYGGSYTGSYNTGGSSSRTGTATGMGG